jgi:hypothetical protein
MPGEITAWPPSPRAVTGTTRAATTPWGLWVRPAAMFAEMVEVEGRSVPRFRLLEE